MKRKNNDSSEEQTKPWSYKPFIYYPQQRDLCESGTTLDAHKHIYVEQTESIKKTFKVALKENYFFSFQGPPNSGKTAMVLNSIIPMVKHHKNGHLFTVIYVDLLAVLMDFNVRTKLNTSFQQCFMDYVLKKVKSKQRSPQTLLQLFAMNSIYVEDLGKNVIFFMDHADVLDKVPYSERRLFVECWYKISVNRNLYCLASMTAIGNYVLRIFTIETKGEKMTPLSKHAYVSYFSKEELFLFGYLYFGKAIPDDIIVRIHDHFTLGHIGQSIVFLKYYVHVWKGYEPPSVAEWEEDIYTEDFWQFCKNEPVLAKIYHALDQEKYMNPLILWLQAFNEEKDHALETEFEDYFIRIGVFSAGRKKLQLSSRFMKDLIESIYTCPPSLLKTDE